MARLRTHRRAALAGAVAVLVVAAVVVGLAQGGGGTSTPDDVPTLAEARADVAGAPGPLARLYAPRPGSAASGGVPVLDLDRAGVRRLLRGLRGRPVLVNVWYPACAPCRREFPILRAAAAAYGTRMGFLGVATEGSRADVDAFLRAQPTVYPHVRDDGLRIARGELQAGNTFPSTVLLDARGEIVDVKGSEYTSLDQLEAALADRLGLRPPAPAVRSAIHGDVHAASPGRTTTPARQTPVPTTEGAAR
jgi:thiol-disulfide isomerase/thioredoxin